MLSICYLLSFNLALLTQSFVRQITIGEWGYFMSLTIKQIMDAEAREKEYYLWDDNPSGLGVRVWPSGNKVFMYVFRKDGRQRRMKLGKFPDITLAQARDLAKVAAASLAQGRDPDQKETGRYNQSPGRCIS